MSAEEMDFGAVIAALEAKRAALDNAISALRAVISSGALSASDGASPSVAAPFSLSGSGEVPDGAFHGMTMPAAIKAYLEMVRSKKTAREISDGLKKGGLESTSKFFDKIVYSTLDRLKKTGEVVKIGGAWGLPAWFPALMRAGAGAKSGRPRRGRPPKSASQGPKLLAADEKVERQRFPRLSAGDMIGSYLQDNPGAHTDEEIRAATKIGNIQVARMILGTLVKRGKVTKEDGKYRKAS